MIFHNGTKNFIKSQLNLINPRRLICTTATTSKASKALPGFCRIVSTGSGSTLWQPCLPKIGRGIFAVFTQVWIIQKCELIIRLCFTYVFHKFPHDISCDFSCICFFGVSDFGTQKFSGIKMSLGAHRSYRREHSMLTADLNIKKICHTQAHHHKKVPHMVPKLSLFEILKTRAFHLKFVCFEKTTKIWKNLPNCFRNYGLDFLQIL